MSETVAAESVLPPAPGAARYLALDFVNSAITLPGGQHLDLLDTPAATNRWLTHRDLAPPNAGVQEVCVQQLRALREHLRVLFAARVSGLTPAPAALSAVNAALTRVPTAALLCWDPENGPHREAKCPPHELVDRALATLATDAAELLTGSDADFLTTCDSAPCDRYLLRQGRRHWCSTRCGDRARAARAYARRTQALRAT